MKKFSLLALAAFSMFACPMFAYAMFAEESEESPEEPVAIETTDVHVSFSDEEEENVGSYLALSDDEEEENTASA